MKLYLAKKLIEKAISGQVQLARYISTSMTLKYDILGPIYSSFSQGRNGSFVTSNEQTTIEELKGYALSI